jgi:hypothetical protein
MRGRDFISLLGGAAAPALGTPLFAQTAAKRARITSRGSDLTDDQKPTVPYWHLYTDENGISRQRRCLMTRFELKSIQPPADPQWQGVRYHDGMTTMVIVLPVAWVGTWHENPAPQWIIPLSGRWWVESMDGERVEMGPGHISFGEDQGCIILNGRIGHRSGTIGTEPAVLMLVQFDKRRANISPCRFE